MTMTATIYPLTRRAMAVWPRWRAGSESARRFEEQGLHPDEIAGLKQLACNLLDAGPGNWFEVAGCSLRLTARAARLLFRGLRIDPGAVRDVSRALEAAGEKMPYGGPLALENAVREHAGVEKRPGLELADPKPAEPKGAGFTAECVRFTKADPKERKAKHDAAMSESFASSKRKERTMTVAATLNGTGNGTGAQKKWRSSAVAFAAITAAAAGLKVDLSVPQVGTEQRKAILKQVGYSDAMFWLVAQDWQEGRRPGGPGSLGGAPLVTPAQAAVTATPEPAPIEVAVTPVEEPAAPTLTEETTHPVTTLRQGEEPVTEGRPALVTRLLDQQMGDGGHLPVDMAALEAENAQLRQDLAGASMAETAARAERDEARQQAQAAENERSQIQALYDEAVMPTEREDALKAELAALRAQQPAPDGEPCGECARLRGVIRELLEADSERFGSGAEARLAKRKHRRAIRRFREAEQVAWDAAHPLAEVPFPVTSEAQAA